jgi:hypothetical protein
MVRTQISLTEDQHIALTKLAKARGTSMSALVRQAVDELVRLSGATAAEALLKWADEYGGPMGGDIATRHDEILGEGRW